jgi:hypothetical protein
LIRLLHSWFKSFIVNGVAQLRVDLTKKRYYLLDIFTLLQVRFTFLNQGLHVLKGA